MGVAMKGQNGTSWGDGSALRPDPVVILHCSSARCRLWGRLGKGCMDLFVLFLITAREPTTIAKLKV